MPSNSYIWSRILARLESVFDETVVQNWFDDAEIVDLTDDQLILSTPSPFCKELICTRCRDTIEEVARELVGRPVELVVLDADKTAQYYTQPATVSSRINERFTFDNFVIGSSNRFAAAAARAVSENPGGVYNPLFIYGQSGLGKTHLLYAIANAIRQNSPGKELNILYIKGDEFTNELIAAIGAGKQQEFHNKYRSADLFLMDDIQFIAGKESTQEEFFHTFNALYEAGKQIVLTSDRPPKEMLRLEDRLQTRFNWGLIADIQPPDYETRSAIVRSKAENMGCTIPDDVTEYIAENLTANVRQLEGAVKKIAAYITMENFVVNVANVSRAIKDMYTEDLAASYTAANIISETANYYALDESELRGQSRSKVPAEARQIAIYLVRKLTTLSFPEIGKEFGRNHTTVMYSVEKVEQQLAEERQATVNAVRDITNKLNKED